MHKPLILIALSGSLALAGCNNDPDEASNAANSGVERIDLDETLADDADAAQSGSSEGASADGASGSGSASGSPGADTFGGEDGSVTGNATGGGGSDTMIRGGGDTAGQTPPKGSKLQPAD